MKYYEVIAQFAKAGAPSFYTQGYEEYLNEAKDHFNVRSRVATNPKEITELEIVDDRTIRIVFRSNAELNIAQTSRSLRVFSMYLIDREHPLNFSDLVSGKRLFRMEAAEISAPDEKSGAENGGLSDAELFIELAKLFFSQRETAEKREKITKIMAIMEDDENARI